MKQNNEFTLSELRKIIKFANYAEASYSGSNGSDVILKAQNMIRTSVEKTDELNKPHHILEKAINEATKHIRVGIEQIKEATGETELKGRTALGVSKEQSIEDIQDEMRRKQHEVELLRLELSQKVLKKAFDLLDI